MQSGKVQPAVDDPLIAKKKTYWESDGPTGRSQEPFVFDWKGGRRYAAARPVDPRHPPPHAPRRLQRATGWNDPAGRRLTVPHPENSQVDRSACRLRRDGPRRVAPAFPPVSADRPRIWRRRFVPLLRSRYMLLARDGGPGSGSGPSVSGPGPCAGLRREPRSIRTGDRLGIILPSWRPPQVFATGA